MAGHASSSSVHADRPVVNGSAPRLLDGPLRVIKARIRTPDDGYKQNRPPSVVRRTRDRAGEKKAFVRRRLMPVTPRNRELSAPFQKHPAIVEAYHFPTILTELA